MKYIHLRLRDTWERYSCAEIMQLLLVNRKPFPGLYRLPIHKAHHLTPLWSKTDSEGTYTTERQENEINRQVDIHAARVKCL